MSYIARSEIHAETWKSIQIEQNPFDGKRYTCGCYPHPERGWESFHLCEYHDGYDAGCEALERSLGGVREGGQ